MSCLTVHTPSSSDHSKHFKLDALIPYTKPVYTPSLFMLPLTHSPHYRACMPASPTCTRPSQMHNKPAHQATWLTSHLFHLNLLHAQAHLNIAWQHTTTPCTTCEPHPTHTIKFLCGVSASNGLPTFSFNSLEPAPCIMEPNKPTCLHTAQQYAKTCEHHLTHAITYYAL